MSAAFVGTLVAITALALSLAASVTGARGLAYPKPHVTIAYDVSGGDQPRVGVPIQFRAEIQAGNDLTYNWSFGENGTATGQTATYTFQQDGQVTVDLDVRDPIGQTASAETTVTVLPPKPTACFQFQQEQDYPLTVDFDGSCSTGTNLQYAWSFGDGSSGDQYSGASTSHSYDAVGTFTVQLTVTDTANQSATTSQSVTISIPAPTASFTWQVDSFSNSYIDFDASASTGYQLSYSWTYGDGQSDTNIGAQPYHYYSSPGTYKVTLTVTDALNRSAKSSRTVTVTG